MKILNNQILKLFVISCAFVLFSCDKNIQTIGTKIVSNVKTEGKNQIAGENCGDFTGDYTTDRYQKQQDAKIRLHELKCAYKAKIPLKSLVNDTARLDNILHLAAYQGDLESVKFLVEVVGTDVDVLDSDSNTPLISSIGDGGSGSVMVTVMPTESERLEVIKYLISKGANINAVSTGFTPLYQSAVMGELKFIEYLMSMKADPTITPKNTNQTACRIASSQTGNPNRQAMLTAMHNCQKN